MKVIRVNSLAPSDLRITASCGSRILFVQV
jgi:hypothetical protein